MASKSFAIVFIPGSMAAIDSNAQMSKLAADRAQSTELTFLTSITNAWFLRLRCSNKE